MNRAGRHEEALVILGALHAEGQVMKGFYREAGWALLETGETESARAYLERHLQEEPGDAEARALLGRALFAAGQWEAAGRELEAAFRAKPSLNRGWAALAWLGVEQKRGRSVGLREFVAAARSDPGVASAMRDRLLGGLAAGVVPVAKRWALALTVAGGYNSNVIGLADGLLLPSEISNKGAGFARTVLDGVYQWPLGPKDVVAVGYVFQADVFEGAGAADLIDHFFHATWLHDFGSGVAGSVRLSDQFTMVGGESYRNQVGVRPGLTKRWGRSWLTEVAFPIGVNDYYFRTNPVQNRDGVAYGPSVGHSWWSPDGRWQARALYRFTRNDAEGRDFQFGSHGLAVGLDGRLPWKLGLSLAYAIAWDDYDRANSLTGFTRRRKDTIQSVSARLSRPVFWDNLEAYFHYNYTDNDSNINFYRYDQHVWTGGVTWRF